MALRAGPPGASTVVPALDPFTPGVIPSGGSPRASGTPETSRCPAACAGPPARPASREGIMAVVNDYEVTYILRPSLEETEVDERANAVVEELKSRGGEVVGEL